MVYWPQKQVQIALLRQVINCENLIREEAIMFHNNVKFIRNYSQP